jgi:predicted DCC family thiol-disulfide oxidoreductase YuxK
MPGSHLVLYDGVCGLCHRFVIWILRRDRAGLFHFAALDSATARQMLATRAPLPRGTDSLVVVADRNRPDARLLIKSEGAVFVATALGWPWRAAAALRAVPRPLRDAVYDLVARHRYRVFGKFEVCPVPPAEWKNRFAP